MGSYKESLLLMLVLSLTLSQGKNMGRQNNDAHPVNVPETFPSVIPPPSPLDDCDPEMIG